jgi:alkyl hydroperoxide reductase subunit AhpC
MKQLSEIFFPFGRYRNETINLLILEDRKDSSNVSFLGPMEFTFLGPMEFIGIGRSSIK